MNIIDCKTQKAEKSLWIDFMNGDDGSYELIYNRYIDVLFRYGIQFTKDEAVVEDAIHDVFIKLYSDRKQLKIPPNIKFYLFTCLKHHLYNLQKRMLLFEQLDDYEKYDVQDATSEEEVTQNMEKEEEEENLSRLLAVLTERQREVIYYRYIEELNIDEIGVLMDMNYQSVQNLIQRSLKKMRDILPLFLLMMRLSGYTQSASIF